jgi:restriction system protein
MKSYFRIMLGRQSIYADEAYKGGFIGASWFEGVDLTNKLVEDWHAFNHEMIPRYLKDNPGKSRVAAGLACGFLHTVIKGIQMGDIVLCPDGKGVYYVGEVISEYLFCKGGVLPHRRNVRWYTKTIPRDAMSDDLRHSTGSIGTVSNITRYAEEIDQLISGDRPQTLTCNDDAVEDPSVFALEKHLEEFLVQNWKHTTLGKGHDIYSVDGESVGQQYQTDTGPIDILAISKDGKTLLVVELKKGRASDVVVGQVQRYMGYVQDELAEKGQRVKGIIIAFEDDIRMRRALSVTQNIEFYTYQISFKLEKKLNLI